MSLVAAPVWGEATAADAGAAEGFLAAYPVTSMYLRQNLRHRAARPMRLWLARRGATICGVLGLTGDGILLMQVPDPGLADLGALPALLRGAPLTAMNGEAGQVARMQAALGIPASRVRMQRDEPLCVIDLATLAPAGGEGTRLRPFGSQDDFLVGWRRDYMIEAGTVAPGPGAEEEARAEVARAIAADSHRLLEVAGRPVAMTGFNARLPDMVQVGGVYTPPSLRGQGHARTAVALHLAEARAAGARRAVLFAASGAALRAYAAIGFRQVGEYRLMFCDGTLTLGAATAPC